MVIFNSYVKLPEGNILKTESIFSTTSVVKLQFLALEALHPRHRKSLAQKDILPGAWLSTSDENAGENWMKIVVFICFYDVLPGKIG